MSDPSGQTCAPWWQCAMCGTVIPNGSSHNCFQPATTTGPQHTVPPRILPDRTAELEAENQRLREENDAMRAYLGAPHDDWLYLAKEWNRLRSAIEKLRDEVGASPLRSSFVALRIAEILERES